MREDYLRVLIVDDEFRIGMLIKKLIHWEDLGLECLDVVDHGEKAHEIIIKEIPDIVITDIRMPKISGLDLISMTKEQVKFIVISGYKEFEYAHKALQYGVTDYLLKPINQEELNKVLGKVVNEIHVKQQKERETEALKNTVEESENIIKVNLFNQFLDQNDESSAEKLKESYNLLGIDSGYRGLNIKLDYLNYKKQDQQLDRLTIEKIIDIVYSCITDNVKEELVSEKEYLSIFCLIHYEIENSKNMIDMINQMLTEMTEYLIGFDQYEVTIGLGSEVYEFEQIKYSIAEAEKAVNNRLKLGTGRLIYAEDLSDMMSIDVKKHISKYKELYLMSIESLSVDSLKQTINEIYSEFQFTDDIDFSFCYEIAESLIELFFENVTISDKKGDELNDYLRETYQHCNTIGKLKNLLKENLCEYLEYCMHILENELTKPIRQAVSYIEDHYGEKIVLDDIADIVDLNPVYFSVLFKKEIGMNFKAYLLQVRMRIAKDLIRTSNMTIGAIASEVGYPDARYFSQVFTKHVGIKPALYRKLYS